MLWLFAALLAMSPGDVCRMTTEYRHHDGMTDVVRVTWRIEGNGSCQRRAWRPMYQFPALRDDMTLDEYAETQRRAGACRCE